MLYGKSYFLPSDGPEIRSSSAVVAPGTRPVPPRARPNGLASVGIRDAVAWGDTDG